MPHLDFSIYISQLFWFSLSFGLLFLFFSQFVMPKILGLSVARLNYISDIESQVRGAESKIKDIIVNIESIKDMSSSSCNDIAIETSIKLQEIKDFINNKILEEYKLEMRSVVDELNSYSLSLNKKVSDVSNILTSEAKISSYHQSVKNSIIVEKNNARLS